MVRFTAIKKNNNISDVNFNLLRVIVRLNNSFTMESLILAQDER